MGGDSTLRGQTTVLGAILVFGILVTSLSIFQVYIVPNQNADVELAHQDIVDEDFTRFHGGLMNAAAQNEEYTASFTLGTTYPGRLVTINPPNPQGTLSTSEIGPYDSDVGDIDGQGGPEQLADICGIDPTTETKSLRYAPDYNEVRNVPQNGYENTITYRASNGDFVEYDQQLIRGNVLRLRPLVGSSMSTSETGTVSVDFYAGSTGVAELSDGDTLRLPTQLEETQWENIANGENVEVTDYSSGTVELTLDANFTVRCTPIGINQQPNNNPSFTPGDGPGEGNYLNPVGPGALQLTSVEKDSNDYNIEFYSNGESHTVEKVRIATVNSPGTNLNNLTLIYNGSKVDEIEPNGEFKNTSSDKWYWDKDTFGAGDVTLKGAPANSNAELTLQFELADGNISSYVIELSNNSPNNGS